MFLDICYSTLLIANTFNGVFTNINRFIIKWISLIGISYRHNRLINNDAIFDTRRGNSIASIPFKIILYVFIGSEPENGGLINKNNNIKIEQSRIRKNPSYFPLISSNINIPSDQQSAAMSWPLLRIISGATYSEMPFITFDILR